MRILTLYHDAEGTPITIFFDGSSPVIEGKSEVVSTPDVEILFSTTGQTADQMIERAAHRFKPYGEVLAVTDDQAERDLVIGMGGLASGCLNFICTVKSALIEFEEELKHYNRVEQNRFNQNR